MLRGPDGEILSYSDTFVSGNWVPLHDLLGSSIALVGSSGAITAQYTYEPYGNHTVHNLRSEHRIGHRLLGSVTLDRFGNVYVAPLGVNVGKSLTIVSLSLEGGMIDIHNTPSPDHLTNFLTSHSFSFGAGFVVGGGAVYTQGVGLGWQAGLASPQIGLSYHYGLKVYHLPVSW